MGCQQCWQVWCGQGHSYEQFWFHQYVGRSNDGNRRPADADANRDSNRDADDPGDADTDSNVIQSRDAFDHGSSNDERQKSWSGN